ncbi:MAG TPA: sigma-70 family RNA polymerase sigma factor [Terriglobales bacterium]|nr:sigma-70 family RNA polymerase sigma factor [Terriglobales bacterium]
MPVLTATQDSLYQQCAAEYAGALERLARSYEAEPEARRDLLQDIHVALWRSFSSFNGLCSMRTWIYRVAHNTAVTHVLRERRRRGQAMVGLEEIEEMPATAADRDQDRQQRLNQLLSMIRTLKPIDRQVILAYLEDLEAAEIAEITGLSPANVATKIHRIKNILSRRFQAGERP